MPRSAPRLTLLALGLAAAPACQDIRHSPVRATHEPDTAAAPAPDAHAPGTPDTTVPPAPDAARPTGPPTLPPDPHASVSA